MEKAEQIYWATIAAHFHAIGYITTNPVDGKPQPLFQPYPEAVLALCEECRVVHSSPPPLATA